jgi:hypothetical protein
MTAMTVLPVAVSAATTTTAAAASTFPSADSGGGQHQSSAAAIGRGGFGMSGSISDATGTPGAPPMGNGHVQVIQLRHVDTFSWGAISQRKRMPLNAKSPCAKTAILLKAVIWKIDRGVKWESAICLF